MMVLQLLRRQNAPLFNGGFEGIPTVTYYCQLQRAAITPPNMFSLDRTGNLILSDHQSSVRPPYHLHLHASIII